MTRQKPTHPDAPNWTLSPQQATAVDLLAAGRTVTDAALAIDVTRQTVSDWSHHHLGFQVALNRRRQELWNELTDTLCGMVPRALQVLQDALDGDQKFAAAIQVLKAAGLYGLVSPPGPTELEDAVLEAQQRDVDRKRRKEDALLRSLSLPDQLRAMGATSV